MTTRYVNKYRSVSQQGVSLVELLVSLLIGLLILAGVVQLFGSSTQTSFTNEALSRIQENARYAFRRIGDDISIAGSFGCLNHSQAPDGLNDANLLNADSNEQPYIVNRLDVNAGTADDVQFSLATFNPGGIAVTNADSWNDFEWAFISGESDNADNADEVRDGTDTLILKYADSKTSKQVSTWSGSNLTLVDMNNFNVADNSVVIAANCLTAYVLRVNNVAGAQVNFQGNNNSLVLDSNTMAAYLYAGETGAHRYFIGTSAAAPPGEDCADTDTNRQYCSLFRETNGVASEELLQGVHDMQVQYAIEDRIEDDLSQAALPNGISDGDNDGDRNDDQRLFMESIDRVQVQLSFNSVQAAGEPLIRSITRVFAVRNQR